MMALRWSRFYFNNYTQTRCILGGLWGGVAPDRLRHKAGQAGRLRRLCGAADVDPAALATVAKLTSCCMH